MKLDIVYMDTISMIEFHCTVYEKCIVGQFIRDWRLKTCFSREVCILRGPGKREIRNPVFCTSRGGFVEREFVSCSLTVVIRYLYVL